jgi:predicted GNAT family N-acyltransferase
MGRALSPVEGYLRERGLAVSESSWEFGRLVIDPRYRAGHELLQKCVFLGVSHLATNAACRFAYASCSQVLSRLYRRFGFSVVADDLRVAGEEKPYHLIRAEVHDVLMSSATSEHDRALAQRLVGERLAP